jgi:hypothetical protein
MTRTSVLLATAAMASLGIACGGGDGAAPQRIDLAGVQRDLALGARGEDVRAVNDYLARYGYFPNADLAAHYPAWRPIVAEAPTSPDVFDMRTAEALAALQRNMGLPVTVVVDDATRAVLRSARCGIPEGVAAAIDDSDKFAWWNPTHGWWTRNSSVTYKVLLNTFPSLLQARVPSLVASAFHTWEVESSLSFASTTGTPNITIQFGTTQNGAAELVSEFTTGVTVTLSNSSAFIWNTSLAGSACGPANTTDMLGVLTHELGHALGLDHSSKGSSSSGAVMYPVLDNACRLRTLDIDDKIAISSRYDVYAALPGAVAARDIGVGANGDVWVISGTPHPSGLGYKVAKWMGASLDVFQESAAVRVAVAPDGRPWVLDNRGFVFRLTTNSVETGSWESLPGVAGDIGIGSNGSVWVTGGWCNGADCPLFQWSPAINNWVQDPFNGSGVRISVGPDGIPWVLKAAKTFSRFVAAPNGHWETVTGQSVDLGIGPGGHVWSFGPLSNGMLNLSVWDEQSAVVNGSTTLAPAVSTWTPGRQPCTADSTSAVAVGPADVPYVLCNGGAIVTPTR